MTHITYNKGNVVFPTEINTLCPMQYLEQGKQISYDYFTEIEKIVVTIDQMFTKFVRPIGTESITHCWCPRIGYTNQLQSQVDRMNSYNLEWIGNKAYTIEDDHNELLSKFVTITTKADLVLTALQLEVV